MFSFRQVICYPGPRGFSRAVKEPRRGKVETRSGEKRKTSGYLGLESHLSCRCQGQDVTLRLGFVDILDKHAYKYDWFV